MKPIQHRKGGIGIRNVDYTYLINLDQRPERWDNSIRQLLPYGIFPQRFPGIYGWSLQPDFLQNMGLVFDFGMWTGREVVMYFSPEKNGDPEFVYLSGAMNGKACFSGWTVKGTIGCSLSHFSVLKDAYDQGYNTIWILEDDIDVLQDPHILSDRIEELDALVGPDGWDVLYTDFDHLVTDPTKDLASQIPMMWRPDMPFLDISFLAEHYDVGDHFQRIGSRMRAHSIIYRRCGIKKIIDFYATHGNFLPYDQEIALIPDIKLYCVKDHIVSYHEVTSDTRRRYFPQ